MSVDVLLRQQGEQLRAEVRGLLDVDLRLAELDAARRRRRRSAGLAGVVTAAASLVLAVGVLGADQAQRERPLPGDLPSRQASAPTPDSACRDSELVQCLGGRMVRVRTGGSYRFVVPEGFDEQVDVDLSPSSVVHQVERRAGFTVLPEVRPVDESAGVMSARRLAGWLASRPYVDAGAVVRDRVDHLVAWSVPLRPVRGGPWTEGSPELAQTCNGVAPSCRPMLRSPNGGESGVYAGMTARYTLVDLGGGRVLALWSWAFEDEERAMALNQELQESFVVE